MDDPSHIVILATCGGREEAERIAGRLVGDRLAACVNILDGVNSVYRWKGQVERGKECLLLIKTSRVQYPRIEAAIKEASSYECPEVIALPIVAGSAEYLRWVGESINP